LANDSLHTVASIFPLVHVTQALQHAMLSTPSVAWGDLGVMAIWAVGAALVALRTLPVAAVEVTGAAHTLEGCGSS
jgi:hypothetical protein